MSDLQIPWWNVDLGAEAEQAVAKAVHNRCLSMGKLVEQFEQRMSELLMVPHVVAVTSGTAALMLAMLEAGVGPGDEVIVPNRTWIATAHAAYLLGATTVFVDVEPQRPVMAVEAFEAAITPRTKVVVPVHLNGCNCDMPHLRTIAERHGIIVVEDAAQALLSVSTEGGYLGTHSHSGCFSLSVAKLFTSGQGGFVVTHDAQIARRLRLMRTHGTEDVVHAHWLGAGGNFRYTDIHASIALAQLDVLPRRIERLVALYKQYADGLRDMKKVQLLPVDVAHKELPLYIEILADNRDELLCSMAEEGIQTRPAYPDLHTAPQFSCASRMNFPHSKHFAEHCLTLPSGPDQKPEHIAHVLNVLQQQEK